MENSPLTPTNTPNVNHDAKLKNFATCYVNYICSGHNINFAFKDITQYKHLLSFYILSAAKSFIGYRGYDDDDVTKNIEWFEGKRDTWFLKIFKEICILENCPLDNLNTPFSKELYSALQSASQNKMAQLRNEIDQYVNYPENEQQLRDELDATTKEIIELNKNITDESIKQMDRLSYRHDRIKNELVNREIMSSYVDGIRILREFDSKMQCKEIVINE